MSETLTKLKAFIGRWRRPIESRANLAFKTRALDNAARTPAAVADTLVQSLGYKAIGANWEMLDDGPDADAPRSAIAAFGEAMSNDMVFSKSEWLGQENGQQCGREFIDCFAARQRTVLTNRMYFGWNPITSAAFEWAFVGYDDQAIALLLLTAEG